MIDSDGDATRGLRDSAARGQVLTDVDGRATAEQKFLAEERLAAQDLWAQLQVRDSRLSPSRRIGHILNVSC